MLSDVICWLQNTVSGIAGVRWSNLQKTYTAYQEFVHHWLVCVRVGQMYSIDSNPHGYCAYWSDILEGILTLQTFLALSTFPFCLSHEICQSVSTVIVVAWITYNTIEASLLGCYKRVHLESRWLCRSMCTFSKTRKNHLKSTNCVDGIIMAFIFWLVHSTQVEMLDLASGQVPSVRYGAEDWDLPHGRRFLSSSHPPMPDAK